MLDGFDDLSRREFLKTAGKLGAALILPKSNEFSPLPDKQEGFSESELPKGVLVMLMGIQNADEQKFQQFAENSKKRVESHSFWVPNGAKLISCFWESMTPTTGEVEYSKGWPMPGMQIIRKAEVFAEKMENGRFQPYYNCCLLLMSKDFATSDPFDFMQKGLGTFATTGNVPLADPDFIPPAFMDNFNTQQGFPYLLGFPELEIPPGTKREPALEQHWDVPIKQLHKIVVDKLREERHKPDSKYYGENLPPRVLNVKERSPSVL